MARLEGNLMNRLMEGGRTPPLRVGMDVTECLWSDRRPYYVVEVTDQRHIKVMPYHVCADHDKAGGMGHQNWMYFKTANDMNRYLNGKCGESYRTDFPEEKPREWVFRYGNWYEKHVNRDGKATYSKKRLRWGVADYYYDWEF